MRPHETVAQLIQMAGYALFSNLLEGTRELVNLPMDFPMDCGSDTLWI
jgi:hypothetical protein